MANTLSYRPQNEGVWVVGPMDTVDDNWTRHEYTAIYITMLANRLVTVALSPQVRTHLIQWARDFTRQGFSSSTDGWRATRGPLAWSRPGRGWIACTS